jgi:hypothetical protein
VLRYVLIDHLPYSNTPNNLTAIAMMFGILDEEAGFDLEESAGCRLDCIWVFGTALTLEEGFSSQAYPFSCDRCSVA